MKLTRRTLLTAAAILPSLRLLGEDEAHPIVELDKPVYARGEHVRFWVGVEASGSIPPEKQKGGVLHIVRPDGVQETQPSSWPIDGPGDRGWKGGSGLGKSPVMLGTYRLSFEWDQKRSPEVELTVQEWDLETRILTRWTFEGSDFRKANAVFTVENQTSQILRFPRLGTIDGGVSLSYVQGGSNPSRQELFYPEEALRQPGEDYTLAEFPNWKFVDRVPHVTVQSRSKFTQTLELSKVPLTFPVTTPEIRIATLLAIFVGEAGDAGSALYPIRRVVSAVCDTLR